MTMKFRPKGLLKIYLFYGAIFFSLGLSAFLLNREDLMGNASHKLKNSFRELAIATEFDWIESHPREEAEIPVFKDESSSPRVEFIFVDTFNHQEKKVENAFEKIKPNLNRYFRDLFIYSVDSQGAVVPDLAAYVLKKTRSSNQWLIALETTDVDDLLSTGNSNKVLVTLFFSSPEFNEENLEAEIGVVVTQFNHIRFVKIQTGAQPVYRLTWECKPDEMVESLNHIFEVLSQYQNGRLI